MVMTHHNQKSHQITQCLKQVGKRCRQWRVGNNWPLSYWRYCKKKYTLRWTERHAIREAFPFQSVFRTVSPFSPFSPFLFTHLFSWLSSFVIYLQTHKDSSASASLLYAHHWLWFIVFHLLAGCVCSAYSPLPFSFAGIFWFSPKIPGRMLALALAYDRSQGSEDVWPSLWAA